MRRGRFEHIRKMLQLDNPLGVDHDNLLAGSWRLSSKYYLHSLELYNTV